MAGLDNYLASLKDNAGMGGGFQQGLRDQTTYQQGLANLGKTQAENARYTAQTPDSNRVLAAQATKGELDNLQGQADQAAGVQDQRAQANLGDAKVSALKAQQALQSLPVEQQAKMAAGVKDAHMKLMDLVEETLTRTSDVPTTIKTIEQAYPGIEKDANWEQTKAQVATMPPQQALNMIRSTKASLASSDAYGDSKFQGKMIEQAGTNAKDIEVAQIHKSGMVEAAGQRAMAAGGKPNFAELYQQYFDNYSKAPPGSPEREKWRQALNGLRGGMQTSTTTPLGDQVSNKDAFAPDKPQTVHIPGSDMAKLRDHPDLIGEYERRHGIQPGWIAGQLKGK